MIFQLIGRQQRQANTEEINMTTIKQFNNLAEEIEYGALANSCGFGQDGSKSSFRCIADEMIRLRKEVEELKSQLAVEEDEEEEGYTEEDTIAEFIKEADKYGATAEQQERGVAMLKTAFEDEDPLRKAMTMARDNITRVVKENEYLKAKLAEKEKYTCPQDEDLTCGDANYEYYYTTNEDGEMTIWKVPRQLAEIKSSTPNNWDNAVAECFRDEKFGENWDKLTYLIVREMKLKDLVKRKWKPAAEKPKEEEE